MVAPAIVLPTSENNFLRENLASIVAPCDPGTILNQGGMVKLSSGKIVPTAINTDDICGVVDAQNPVASLGDQLTAVKILLTGNVVKFLAPAAESFVFGLPVYAYDNGGNHYTGAVTITGGEGLKQVGTCANLVPITGGAGVKVPVKLLCGQKI